MKIEYKNKSPITIAVLATSIFAIAFAVLSIYYEESWRLRVLAQGVVSLNMLVLGFNHFVHQKQKVLGSFLWIVSGVMLFIMVLTIYVVLQIKIS